ncbi:terpene synthase family protein [Streptomyces sp. NRRL B-1347]|uniref:terpene synthase family protein n=1 Tax=Streptomyces sp. NRRL B-1347 TaxID=1476877 RepID=UPI0004C607D9|nr:hypothetical protein [Streptomyces sp. NRRL B-1347]
MSSDTELNELVTAALDRLRYPFPAMLNPLAEAMQRHTDQVLIDGELAGVVNRQIAEEYKATKTAYMTGYWYPTATREQMEPLCRFMLWSMYNDDLYEGAPAETLTHAREASLAILRGECDAQDSELPLRHQLAAMRAEFLKFLPPAALERWVAHLGQYFTAVITENEYRAQRRYPHPQDAVLIREHSLMVHAFIDVIEVPMQAALPDLVHQNPVLQRLESLAVRIVAYFNDVQSLLKDINTKDDYLNLVRGAQHYAGENISLEQACAVVRGWHDRDLNEFNQLRADLPDFGKWQTATAAYIDGMAFQMAGWRAVHAITGRYRPASTRVDPHTGGVSI